MEMFEQLMAYYQSKPLSELQSEWNDHESHKYEDHGVLVDDLFDYWDGIYQENDIFDKNEKLELNNLTSSFSDGAIFFNSNQKCQQQSKQPFL